MHKPSISFKLGGFLSSGLFLYPRSRERATRVECEEIGNNRKNPKLSLRHNVRTFLILKEIIGSRIIINGSLQNNNISQELFSSCKKCKRLLPMT